MAGEVACIYGALRLSSDIGRYLVPIYGVLACYGISERVWVPVYSGDAWVRWYRESQQQKALIPLVKPL